MAGAAGRSGRRPKPTAKKLLAGNPGKRALNQAEPDFELVLNIDCPDWMGDNGRMLWEAVAPQLCKERILAATDIQNLEVYCSAYDQFRMAQADIAHGGCAHRSPGGNGRIVNQLEQFGTCRNEGTSTFDVIGEGGGTQRKNLVMAA